MIHSNRALVFVPMVFLFLLCILIRICYSEISPTNKDKPIYEVKTDLVSQVYIIRTKIHGQNKNTVGAKTRSLSEWIFPLFLLLKRFAFKASLTFKCMTEHLFADFSYSIALDTYLWKQMMKMNRKLIHIWYNLDKKHLLFTKRKCHKFSWLFTASRCSPRRRSICTCRIACKVLVSIGLYSLSFGFLKKRLPSWKTVFVKRDR